MKETTAPWYVPTLMVRKQNNKWRMCVDYTRLNDIICNLQNVMRMLYQIWKR